MVSALNILKFDNNKYYYINRKEHASTGLKSFNKLGQLASRGLYNAKGILKSFGKKGTKKILITSSKASVGDLSSKLAKSIGNLTEDTSSKLTKSLGNLTDDVGGTLVDLTGDTGSKLAKSSDNLAIKSTKGLTVLPDNILSKGATIGDSVDDIGTKALKSADDVTIKSLKSTADTAKTVAKSAKKTADDLAKIAKNAADEAADLSIQAVKATDNAVTLATRAAANLGDDAAKLAAQSADDIAKLAVKASDDAAAVAKKAASAADDAAKTSSKAAKASEDATETFSKLKLDTDELAKAGTSNLTRNIQRLGMVGVAGFLGYELLSGNLGSFLSNTFGKTTVITKRVDKDGNEVDENGNRIDKDGDIIYDEDGNVINDGTSTETKTISEIGPGADSGKSLAETLNIDTQTFQYMKIIAVIIGFLFIISMFMSKSE